MDNEKNAEIIPFPVLKDKIDNRPIYQVHIKQLFIRITEYDNPPPSKIALMGEIEIKAGDKRVTKKIDVVIPIEIDGLEDN